MAAKGCAVEGELQPPGQLGATGIEDPPGQSVIPKPSVANAEARRRSGAWLGSRVT